MTLHYTILHCNALQYTVLHYTASLFMTCTVLQCSAMQLTCITQLWSGFRLCPSQQWISHRFDTEQICTSPPSDLYSSSFRFVQLLLQICTASPPHLYSSTSTWLKSQILFSQKNLASHSGMLPSQGNMNIQLSSQYGTALHYTV